MITVEKLVFLRHVPLFSRMPTRELGRIAAVATEVVLPAGALIFAESDVGDSMYLVVEGRVRIHRGEHTLAVLGEKAYFGEMSILDGEPRSASAVAVSDCLLLRIAQEHFHDIIAGDFGVALSIIQTLTRRVREAQAAAFGRAPEKADPVRQED